MYQPTKKYFAKVLMTYNNKAPFQQTVLKTFGKDEQDAEANVSTLIDSWGEVDKYIISRISEQPIKLQSYLITVVFRYATGAKTLNIRLHLENPNEANQAIKFLSEDWNHIGYHIIKITKN